MTGDRSAGTSARRVLEGVANVDELTDDEVLEVLGRSRWCGIAEPGDGTAGALIGTVGAIAAESLARTGGVADLMAAIDVDAPTSEKALRRWRPRWADPALADTVSSARRSGVRLLTPTDDAWPRGLDDLGAHAPLCLWLRGDRSALRPAAPSIAMVGARAATAYGEHVAMAMAGELAASGITVVSGAAYGIDGAAHRAALRAGGATIAFLAGGVDRSYPAGHTRLIDDIAASGAVVSEVPCGSPPTRWRFLARNRLIAASSSATVVVEAGWRSGSLNTAAHAASLGRPLGAVPGPVTSAASAGCHRLLREFDARCVTGADDVRELLGVGDPYEALVDAGARTDERTRLRDALSVRAWRRTDDIARRSGLGLEELESALGLLLLEGAVERSGDGWRRVTAPRGRPR